MRNCPTDIQIALFADGSLSVSEEKEMCQHIATCQECSHLLIDVLAINDMQATGLLASPPEEEISRSVAAVHNILSMAQPQSLSLKDRLNNFYGIAAAASVSFLARTAEGTTLLPVFAENHENFSDDFVRNTGLAASTTSEEHKISDHQLNHEGKIMYGEANDGGIQDAPQVIGLPGAEGKSDAIKQHYQDTCAVRSQELILRDFGVQVSEDSLRQEAFDRGWYTPDGGTAADKVGNLLELHGVDVNRYDNANIFTLTDELAKGHKVIIGVDSGELWDKGIMESLSDNFGFQQADHALIVSGIDTKDPEHVKVVLTDPGSGDIAKEYPIEQFIDAWKDSNCFMVTTSEPAPVWAPGMANFDYDHGHINSIGNLSYDNFHSLYATDQNLYSNELLTSLDNPLDNFLQDVAGHDLYPMPPFDVFDQPIDPVQPFDHHVPAPPDPLADVDHPVQPEHEPTIAELIAQHTHQDPNELLPPDTSDGHLGGNTGLDDLYPHV